MGSQLLFLSLKEAEFHSGKVWQSEAAYFVEATNQKCRQEGVMDTEYHPGIQFLRPGFYYQAIKDIEL